MRLWRVGRWSALAATVTLAGCGLLQPSETYRYRVTVEVQTPQGLRSGSSVWDVKAREGRGIPDTAIRSKVRGEAVLTELRGGPLFALLRGRDMNVDYASSIVYRHLYKHPLPAVPLVPSGSRTCGRSRNRVPHSNSIPTNILFWCASATSPIRRASRKSTPPTSRRTSGRAFRLNSSQSR